MQVQLTPEQNSFVELGIQEGRFRDSEEAIRQALALWEKRERARIELLASLDLAELSLDAGEGENYTAETLTGLVESIEERGHIRVGLSALKAGKSVSNERVIECLDSWGTENELPAPRCWSTESGEV